MSLAKLYFNIICPPCRAVYLLAKMLDIKLQYEEVDIMSKQYMQKISKLNHRHTIPILVDRNYVLTDSHAIAPYLVQKYTKNTALYPEDLQKRGVVDQCMHYDSGILYPVLYQAITPILFRNQFGLTVSNVARIQENYGFLNNHLKKRNWLADDTTTIADITCIPTVSTLDMLFPVSKQDYPHLANYLHRCEQLPHYVECNLAGLSKLAQVIQDKMISYNNNMRKIRSDAKT